MVLHLLFLTEEVVNWSVYMFYSKMSLLLHLYNASLPTDPEAAELIP